MVSERVPVAIRGLSIFFAIIAAATAHSRGIKSCSFGGEEYNSQSPVNFLIATSVLTILCVSARIFAFDVKKRLRSVKALVFFDAVFLIFTFAAAIAVALSPVGGDICAAEDDLKKRLQEACAFSCSNVVASVVTMFFTCACFLVSILFTTEVIPTTASLPPAEDFAFGEVGTPRARKLQAQSHTMVGQV